MTGYHALGILLVLAITAWAVWIVEGEKWRGYQAGAREAIRKAETHTWGGPIVGICGNELHGPWGSLEHGPYGVLWCDLPAGHLGWHGCKLPGQFDRTSWTHANEDNGINERTEQ